MLGRNDQRLVGCIGQPLSSRLASTPQRAAFREVGVEKTLDLVESRKNPLIAGTPTTPSHLTPQGQVRTAAEGNMPVWGPLEIKLTRPLKCGFIAVGGGDPRGHGVTSRDLLPAYFSVVASAPHKMIYRRRPEQSLLNCCLQRHNVRPAALAAILLSQGYKGRANSVRRRDHAPSSKVGAVRHKPSLVISAPANP